MQVAVVGPADRAITTNDQSELGTERRSEFERDVDRLLYTFYLRRLAEITQVAAYPIQARRLTGAAGLYHNRLTHSLKVAQVGSRMAQYLLADEKNAKGIAAAGGLDINVVEAAGRAHDLGHPPYGHIGEEILDDFARGHGLDDGFEGNAQTFRILSALIVRVSTASPTQQAGLNLTSSTLAACAKYPWPRGQSGKKFLKYGYYVIDADNFDKYVKPRLPQPEKQTLAAQIMDWADDISYATHDIEDFAADGSIPLSLLAHINVGTVHEPIYQAVAEDEFLAFWDYATIRLNAIGKTPHSQAREQFQALACVFPRRRPDFSRKAEALLGALSSHIITLASNATSVRSDGSLDIIEEVRSLIDVLKQLTWFYVIDRPELVATQRGQRRKLKAVTEAFLQWAMYAYRRSEVKPWGEKVDLDVNTQRANTGALPPLLRDMISSLLAANNRRGAYEDFEKDITRGVIDFVSSLRESQVEEYFDLLVGGIAPAEQPTIGY